MEDTEHSPLHELRGKLRAGGMVARALYRTVRDERRDGTLGATLYGSYRARTLAFAGEPTYAELLERRAAADPDQPFLRFEERTLTLGALDARANALASALAAAGVRAGDAVAIVSGNCPEFLEGFFAIQKLGATAVPINTALIGDGLAYVLDNARVTLAIVHQEQLAVVLAVCERLALRPRLAVITEGRRRALPDAVAVVEDWVAEHAGARPPAVRPAADDAALLLYTSGTTGGPKGVVYRYGASNTKRMRLLANLLYEPGDVLYTCLPLYHANALLLTAVQALNAGARVALSRRFSARRFWEEVARLEATTFNALGAMIPILLKQPPSTADRAHGVRLVVSAACPANAWRPFEARFGTHIVEAYGAVDGGGFISMNLGNAPVGSIGRPVGGARYRLVDPGGEDVAPGQPGELLVWSGRQGTALEYHRDPDATRAKVRDGWIHTGDLLYRDRRGYLYFAGRNTDSMRRRGENVSAFEVESVLDQHPDVLECAVFGVPSELGEDDIMAVVVSVPGRSLEPAAVRRFLEERLARHALPRFVEMASELPKTGTHRVQKQVLRRRGVTARTWDSEAARHGGAHDQAR